MIAHEIGHVAHRDGTRAILQSAGLSFLFGMLLGDFVGGGAVVIGARAVLQSSYSREVEGAADRYGVDLMIRAGGDPRALGIILDRIAGAIHPGTQILSDHPDTKARVAVIDDIGCRGVRAALVAGTCRMARAEAYMHGPVGRAYFARRIPADPTSRLAIWARRFAVFAVAVLLLAIVIVRAGILEIVPSLAAFGGALILAGVAMVLALAAFVVIWREGLGGFGMAMIALLVGVAILGYPAYLGAKAYRLPAISDITTDPIDPPRFEAIARLRARDANPIVYAGLRAAELQKSAYPTIEPLLVSVAPPIAFEAAVAGHDQAQMAHRRCARAAGRTPRGPHRGGGAHGDLRFSRRRRAARPPRSGRRADRYPLDLALRPARFRHQCGARDFTCGRDRRCGRQSQARRHSRGARSPRRPSRRLRASQAKNAADRRRVRRSRPRRAPIRSSRCASTENPAASVSRGSSPI